MRRLGPGAAAVGCVITLIALCGVGGVAGAVPDGPRAEPGDAAPLVTLRAIDDDRVVVEWDREAVRAAASSPGRIHRALLPLGPGRTAEIEIEPFRVLGRGFRAVVGRRGAPDRPLSFDPATVATFRGRVVGRPGSDVYLALSDSLSTGFVDLGAGGTRFRISGRARKQGADSSVAGGLTTDVFEAAAPPALPPDVPFCGVDHAAHADGVAGLDAVGAGGGGGSPEMSAPLKGLLHLELAIETDFEFFQLFGDLNDAMAYLTAMYGEVSHIYARDVDTRVELVFARLWDDPDDLFNDVDPSPLSDFRDYWNANMGSVQRDVAQLLSGRRDYPFGGQAYVSALCNTSAYSVVGYAMGFFPDPSIPSPYHYDISVTAHEIGHNAGTGHTHDSPNFIDTCDDPMTTPQRGTIMSYCGQTWSGGNANRDLYFHSTIQSNMDSYIGSVSCVVDDCNQNGIADATDIAQATSADADSNGIPDECEDCNANLVLDDTDISMGTSMDVDGNGVPDECQPDCNANGIPDAKDIADATSTDAYGNDVPDECETDCNANGTSDYTDIQADMTLDVDRDARLDGCQDCDGDGTADLVALAGRHHAWSASGLTASPVRQLHATTGVLTIASGGGGPALADEAFDLVVAPDGRLLATSHADHRVMQFAADGTYLSDLVASGAGGLNAPTGLIVTPDNLTLLVSSSGTSEVLAYDVATGSPAGAFIAAGAGGLSGPFGLTFGPNGNLFVTSDTNEILEYDGTTGALVGTFVAASANGGLDQPRGLAFKPDGDLLVASFGTDRVLAYDGQTGAPLGKWAQVGTATRLTQVSPWGIRVGPNGNVYVTRTGEDYGSGSGGALHHDDHAHGTHGDAIDADDDDHHAAHADREHGHHAALHLTNAQIYEYDARTGNFVRTYVGGNDHGLLFPTGFDFVPGYDMDCNVNLLPDSCDIASGFSQDLDADGTPDECEADCNANGVYDRLDVIPHGTALDCNANFTPDACDLSSGASLDCTSNGIPDECETDCNLNGIADSCDIDAGTSTDCDGNGIPDECDVTDDFEQDTGWTVGAPGDTATSGVWERVDPVGTAAQPEDDHTPGAGTHCFVTGQGAVGGSDGANDVDGGATTLLSPVYNLTSDPETEIAYWRWYSNDAGSNPNQDVFTIDVSDDGGQSWTNVETVGPGGAETGGGWFRHQFRVADFVSTTATVMLRFVAEDAGSGSIVEAAVDDLSILATCCTPPGEAQGLLLTDVGVTRLSWSDLGASVLYDVVSGDLATLAASGSVADATCQSNDQSALTWDDTRPDPSAGGGYYYLVRGTSCAAGSYGTSTAGGERQPASDCP